MPEFLIPYLGKIKVEFLFIEYSGSLRDLLEKRRIDEKKLENLQDPENLGFLVDYLTGLLIFKEYSSCFLIFDKLKARHPVLLFNLALAAVFTQDFKLGLELLRESQLDDPNFLLLNVVFMHFLHREVRALQIFAEYQRKFVKHSRNSTVLFKNSVSNHLPKRKVQKTEKSLLKMNKTEYFKTTELATLTTSASQPHFRIKRAKQVKIENHPKIRIFKQRTVLKPFLGLNDIMLHSGTLPDLSESTFNLKKFPDFPIYRSPKDDDLPSLSKISLLKVISHFTKTPMNLNQLHSILRKLKFFKQYSKDRCFELLEHSTYQFFHQGEVIFKEGDFADKIFVILQGSVSVQQEYKGLNIYVNSRYDGDTIGEYALARGSVEKSFAKRSATCIAGESLHTLFITSDDYMEIMNKAADNENAIIAHLKEFRLFQHIQNVDLAYLANCLHVTVYAFEECILQAGLVPKGLYLIVNGRVKAVYKNKVVELPPKYFFGQKVMLGEFKPSSCQILSNAVETSIILIEPSLIGLIYKQVRDITMSILALHEKQDL